VGGIEPVMEAIILRLRYIPKNTFKIIKFVDPIHILATLLRTWSPFQIRNSLVSLGEGEAILCRTLVLLEILERNSVTFLDNENCTLKFLRFCQFTRCLYNDIWLLLLFTILKKITNRFSVPMKFWTYLSTIAKILYAITVQQLSFWETYSGRVCRKFMKLENIGWTFW